MKSSVLFSLLFACLFVFQNAFAQQSIAMNVETTTTTRATQAQLTQAKPFVTAEVTRLGRPDYSNAEVVTFTGKGKFKGKKIYATTIPMITKGNASRAFYSYQVPGEKPINMIIEASPITGNVARSKGLNMKVKIYDEHGKMVNEVSFLGSERVRTRGAGPNSTSGLGDLLDCIDDAWDTLPWYVQAACDIVRYSPVVIGCIGGQVAACLYVMQY